MYDDTPVLAAPINQTNDELPNRVIEVKRWQYDPGKETMQVYLQTEKSGESEISFMAKERENPKEDLPIEVAATFDNNYILNIDVPEDYTTVGLVVQEEANMEDVSNQLEEIEVSFEQQEEEQEEDEEQNNVTFYGDYREVEEAKIVKDDAEALVRDALQQDIKTEEKKITTINDELVPEVEERIQGIEESIKEVEDAKEYQTTEEKMESDKQIVNYNRSIEDLEGEIEELELSEDEAKEKIEVKEKQIQSVKEEQK